MQNFLASAQLLLFTLNLLPLVIYIYTLKPFLNVINSTEIIEIKNILTSLTISFSILLSASVILGLISIILNPSPIQLTLSRTIILFIFNTIAFQLSTKFLSSHSTIIQQIKNNRLSIDRLKVFYESTTDGILISEVDDSGNAKVIDCNDRIILMTGYSRNEIINGNQSEFLDHTTRKAEISSNINRTSAPYLSYFYRNNGTSFPVVIKNTFPNVQSNIKITSVRTLEGDLLAQQNKAEQEAAIGMLLEQFKPSIRSITLLENQDPQDPQVTKDKHTMKDSLKVINDNLKDLLGEL